MKYHIISPWLFHYCWFNLHAYWFNLHAYWFIGNTTTAPRARHWDPPAGAHEFAGQAVTRLRQMLWSHLEGGRFREDILTNHTWIFGWHRIG